MSSNNKLNKGLFLFAMALCFLPFISPYLALLLGILFSFFGIKNSKAASFIPTVLQLSIALIGFGINFHKAVEYLEGSLVETGLYICFVMIVGTVLGGLFKLDSKITVLISAGTAICGGSAIAILTPILGCKPRQTSFALITIFSLNILALFAFPYIGHYFDLSQEIFGYWAAIAIHDTSSVIGATTMYGNEAVEVGTTVKLVRTLWIVPLAAILVLFKKGADNKIKFPWFILYFILAIAIAYFFQSLQSIFIVLNQMGKQGIVCVLFLIGSSVSFKKNDTFQFKNFVMALILWLMISIISFVELVYF